MSCTGRVMIALCLSLWITAGAQAAPVILDFESFRVDDALIHNHAGELEFQGFTILSVPPPGNAFRFSSAGTLHPLFPGSTALWNGQSNAENILTASNGGAFSLFSMDLAALPPGASDPAGMTDPGPFDLTFTGTRSGGSTVSNTFTINNTFLALERFAFTGFQNVTSVSWFQGSGFNPPGPPLPGQATHQFDRIVVAPVPEPSSLLLFLLGGAGVLLSRTTRRPEPGR